MSVYSHVADLRLKFFSIHLNAVVSAICTWVFTNPIQKHETVPEMSATKLPCDNIPSLTSYNYHTYTFYRTDSSIL